jgi:hypothetical protein
MDQFSSRPMDDPISFVILCPISFSRFNVSMLGLQKVVCTQSYCSTHRQLICYYSPCRWTLAHVAATFLLSDLELNRNLVIVNNRQSSKATCTCYAATAQPLSPLSTTSIYLIYLSLHPADSMSLLDTLNT